MAVNFNEIPNLPSLPAVLRETPNVAPQVNSEMNLLSAVREATVNTMIKNDASFGGKHDHDIEIISASSRAMNAILTMVTGQPQLGVSKSGRSR